MSASQSPEKTPLLDRPVARVLAGVLFLAVLALLAWLHRDDLFPPEAAPVAEDDPVALCLAARTADIAQMQQDGVITAEQAALFTSRAEALCQAQEGETGLPPE